MKPSAAQLRIVNTMAAGAVLRWSSTQGHFELRDGATARTIQTRTIDALSAAGLIERDILGDCMLTSKAAAISTSSHR